MQGQLRCQVVPYSGCSNYLHSWIKRSIVLRFKGYIPEVKNLSNLGKRTTVHNTADWEKSQAHDLTRPYCSDRYLGSRQSIDGLPGASESRKCCSLDTMQGQCATPPLPHATSYRTGDFSTAATHSASQGYLREPPEAQEIPRR